MKSCIFLVCFISAFAGITALATNSAPVSAAVPATPEQEALGNEWAPWFASGATLQKVVPAPVPVFAVTSAGKVCGWVFRTDQVPPASSVNGKHGPITVLVGLGTDGLIKGVRVLQNHEDKAYFSRLQDSFYQQFSGRPANGSDAKVDTVTGATVSSKAIIKSVFESSQTVLAIPAVHALVNAHASAATR